MSIFLYQPGGFESSEKAVSCRCFGSTHTTLKNNCLLLRDGKHLPGGGQQRHCGYGYSKALTTERFRYTAYDGAFGSEIPHPDRQRPALRRL